MKTLLAILFAIALALLILELCPKKWQGEE